MGRNDYLEIVSRFVKLIGISFLKQRGNDNAILFVADFIAMDANYGRLIIYSYTQNGRKFDFKFFNRVTRPVTMLTFYKFIYNIRA